MHDSDLGDCIIINFSFSQVFKCFHVNSNCVNMMLTLSQEVTKPTIAQKCRFWQSTLWQRLDLTIYTFCETVGTSEWSFATKRSQSPGFTWSLYHLSGLLIPKGLNILIGCYLLSIFQLICPLSKLWNPGIPVRFSCDV